MKICERNEIWKVNGNDFEYAYTKVILREGNEYFYARSTHRYAPSEVINIDDLVPVMIPASELWPDIPDNFTLSTDPLPPGTYIKQPSLIDYDEDSSFCPKESLLEEARVCEILRKHPHRNIARYLGCQVQHDRIIGLCFTKYHATLHDRVKDREYPLGIGSCDQGIEAGIQHLHSLGLVHNDINPHNIMFLNDDIPVIIDFDSCRPEGSKLVKGGTWGWCLEDATMARRENDYHGLQKIRDLLRNIKSECSFTSEGFNVSA